MRIFSSPKQSPRHSKNCLWKSAPHKRGSWSVVTLSHLKSCIHCFLHICLNIQMQIYALHSLKNLSYFWILQPRVDFTHIQNVLEYQSLIIDMHWKKVTILMWNTPKGQTKLEIKGCIIFAFWSKLQQKLQDFCTCNYGPWKLHFFLFVGMHIHEVKKALFPRGINAKEMKKRMPQKSCRFSFHKSFDSIIHEDKTNSHLPKIYEVSSSGFCLLISN